MIMHRPDPAAAIRSLRSAAPYIRMYKGKTFVVKAGGGVFADAAAVRGLIEQIAILHYFGVRVVFVHGGGPQLTEITEALGVPTRMVQGRRVTDQKAIDATSMVLNGLINTKLLALCREMNIDAVGHQRRRRRPDPRAQAPAGEAADTGETVDYGFVGDIDAIDTTRHQQAARQRPHAGRQPAVRRRPRHAAQHQRRHGGRGHRRGAVGREAHVVHRRAGHPRARRRSDARSFRTPTSPASSACARRRRSSTACCRRPRPSKTRIRGGVRRVHVMSYKSPEGILAEVFTNEGAGTLIVADVNALSPAEQQVGK